MQANTNTLIPKERRSKPNLNEGKLDDLGFFRTPNGSFWDPDDEYFNRHGFDIHAGCYSHDLEYVPGPEWLPEIGCYPEEKEKYLNMKLEDFEDDVEVDDKFIEDEFKGDFEDDDMDNNNELSAEDFKKLQIDEKKLLEQYLGGGAINFTNTEHNKKKKNKKSKQKAKKKQEDSDGWETIEEDDE